MFVEGVQVRPAYLLANEAVYDRAWTRQRLDDACGLAAMAGLPPFPEQKLVLEGIVAVDDELRPAHFECGVVCCRQNLKTGAFKQATIFWLVRTPPAFPLLIVWSAHQWAAVKEAVHDFDEHLAASDDLRREVRKFERAGVGAGEPEIVMRNGTRCLFKTRTKGSGRSLAGDKVVLDEYYAAQAAHLGALMPIMSARTMLEVGGPQVLMGSSAARPESDSLRALVKRGRAGKDPSLFYAEYCAPPPEKACDRGAECDHALDTPGCGCDKPELVRQANPAVGYLISPGHMPKLRRAMPPAEYGREVMGWHDAGAEDAEVIPLLTWADELDEDSEAASRVALACVFSSRRDRAAVGLVGWRSDGLIHVEVADYRPGTAWVTGWLTERWLKLDPLGVVVDPHGHERSIIPDLEAAGVRVVKPTGADVAAAFGMFFDAVTDTRNVRHRGQDDLTLALAGATTRDIGDAGTAWGRRKSGVDISPLVSVTEALWLFLSEAPALVPDDEPGVWVLGDGPDPEAGLRQCEHGIFPVAPDGRTACWLCLEGG